MTDKKLTETETETQMKKPWQLPTVTILKNNRVESKIIPHKKELPGTVTGTAS